MHNKKSSFQDQHIYGEREWEDLNPAERIDTVLATLSEMDIQNKDGWSISDLAAFAEVSESAFYQRLSQAMLKMETRLEPFPLHSESQHSRFERLKDCRVQGAICRCSF